MSVSIWECGPTCGCPPECMNRVIQRGRAAETKIDLFKTINKGWGVRARVPIPKGTYLGMYSGELITDHESERRGFLYNDIGRTYLFDLDGYQIHNPPRLDKLRRLDPRLAQLTEETMERARLSGIDDDEDECYSAYSGEWVEKDLWGKGMAESIVDAFHFGVSVAAPSR